MDFGLDETQRAIAGLARETLSREPAESIWKALARAGLLALALPNRLGGDGLGVLETAVLLTEVGRAAAGLPALHTLALGVLPVVHLGTPAQQADLLPEVATGDRVLSAAVGAGSSTVDEDGALSGRHTGVGYADRAHRVLIPAGEDVYLVDPHATGVCLTRTPTSSGLPEFTVGLDRVPAERLGSAGATRLHRLAVTGACAVGAGLLAGALDRTAAHVRTREQFGRPLAAFQAVAQQVADVYIAARTVHLGVLSACWRLAVDGAADDHADLDVAAYWLTAEAPAALHTCHHLHGGLGVDADYPLHRYYSQTKDLVRFLGGVNHRLDRLGARVAS
ncbi:MAG: acyl-CoA dehydrogenase family protein [Labedaea sp.]